MRDSSGSTTGRVVRAVAEYTDSDPLDLPPLYHTVDPDALEAAVESIGDGSISFEYAERAVSVDFEGTVTVSGSPGGRSEPVGSTPD